MEKIKLHNDYKRDAMRWHDVCVFLEGRIDQIANYLVMTETERAQAASAGGSAIYSSRIERMEYKNHCKYVLEQLRSQANQELDLGDELPEIWDKYIEDVTRYDESLYKFFRQLLTEFVSYGRIGVLVDSPSIEASSVGEAEALGLRPYFVLFPASSILNWSYFEEGSEMGELKEVALRLADIDTDEDKVLVRVKKYLRDGETIRWEYYEVEVDKQKSNDIEKIEFDSYKESGNLATGVIPFYLAGGGACDSGLADVQELSRIRLNKQSAADNIEHLQSFTRTLLKGVDEDTANLWSENSFAFSDNPEAGIETIPANDPTANNKSVDRLDKSIKEVGLKRKSMIDESTRQNQSADSKSKDDDALIEWLDYMLDEIESCLNSSLKGLALYDTSLNEDDISLSIARDYRAEDQEVKIQGLMLLGAEAKAIQATEVQKAIVKKLVQMKLDLPDEEMEELMASIDSAGVPVANRPLEGLFSRGDTSEEG